MLQAAMAPIQAAVHELLSHGARQRALTSPATKESPTTD